MRPIEYKTDIAFMQALRSVEYRVPAMGLLKPSGLVHALALRYGLLGAAASHHLLLSSSDDEEPLLLQSIASWPAAVQQHFRWETMRRLPAQVPALAPEGFSQLAYQPVLTYLALYRRLCPLDQCLRSALDEYVLDHMPEIRDGWGWLQGGRATKAFREVGEQSIHFALSFFERRQACLEEVPEIALLGE